MGATKVESRRSDDFIGNQFEFALYFGSNGRDNFLMAGSVPSTQRWLYGPTPDLLFGCGLLYAVLFAVFAFAGPAAREFHPAYLIPLLMILLSTPHYGATLLRVYEHGADRRAYAFFTVWLTVALCVLFVVAVYVNWVGTMMLTLYLTWSPWHYTGQNYGVAVMSLGRGGVRLPADPKRWLFASFILPSVLLFFVMPGREPISTSGNPYFVNGGVHLTYLGIPDAISSVAIPVAGFAYLVALAVTWTRLLKLASFRELLPVAMLCLTQALWFAIPEAARYWQFHGGLDVINFDYRTYYFSWIVFGHAIQYLWITAYFAKAANDWKGHGRFWGKTLLIGNAMWMLPAMILTPDGFGSLTYDLGLGLLVASFVNLHHFVLDGAIWKLRSSRIAKVLIRSAKDDREARSEGSQASPWTPMLIWGFAAVLLLGTGVEFYERQVRIPAALGSGAFEAAGESLDRMAWLAKDSAQARVELGRELMRANRIEAAEVQYQRSIDLQPGMEANAAIGEIRARSGRWQDALDAYAAALAIDPSHAGMMSLVAGAHLSLGQLDKAQAQFEHALRLSPGLETARSGLARIAQMRSAQ